MHQKKVGNFKITSHYDSENKLASHEVTWKGDKVNTVNLDTKESKKYMGYELIKKDLVRVIEWSKINIKLFESIESQETKQIMSSLLVSIVITYWKCFAQTEGRERVQLDENCVKNSMYEKMHFELKKIRHNYIAHSGIDNFEEGSLLFVEGQENKYGSFTLPITVKASTFDKKFSENVIKLAESIIKVVEHKQEKTLKTVLRDHEKLKG